MGPDNLSTQTKAKPPLELEEYQCPTQTKENDEETVVRVSDQADLDGGGEDAKRERTASMGSYFV